MADSINFRDMDIEAAINKGVTNALVGLANIAVTQAKSIVAVDTGRLRNSITWKMKEQQGRTSANSESDTIIAPTDDLQVAFGTNVEYAPYVEYGTDKMAAKPYIAPAKIKVQREIENGYVASKIRQELRRAGRL